MHKVTHTRYDKYHGSAAVDLHMFCSLENATKMLMSIAELHPQYVTKQNSTMLEIEFPGGLMHCSTRHVWQIQEYKEGEIIQL